ncbi:MAG: DUF2062 domain-containing protein [Desulfobacteraceae bacterium]
MNPVRLLKYYYRRFIRLKGIPRNLALGISIGIFAGLMPIMPFQTAFAVLLAVLLKASKISAAVGTWISNPLNWYFIYYLDYKIGAALLGLSEHDRGFSSIIDALRNGEEGKALGEVLIGAGPSIVGAFFLGGLVLGLIAASISYPIFLKVFETLHRLRRARRSNRRLSRINDQR